MKNLILCLAVCLVSSTLMATTVQQGYLIAEHGDSFKEEAGYHLRYRLVSDSWDMPLRFSNEFMQRVPLNAWVGKRVKVSFKTPAEQHMAATNWVQAIELTDDRAVLGGDVTGAQPWVSILCKFNDVNDEPKNQNFFQNMYANLPAGLDHYWREVSYDNINVVGSVAVDWVDLPSSQSTYAPDPGSGTEADLSLLFNDCTEAADPFVNYASGANGSSFVGINMMFNELLDCCAWGGGRGATLDGLNKFWRVTWNPPWSFANEGVIAHEMGHGFGLPHANNSDGDDNPYDNPWDVMSSSTGRAVNDAVYGRLGKHINMEFKHRLGWVTDADGFIADSETDAEVIIDYSAIDSTPNHRFARIPLTDGTYYVLETRKTTGNYESNLAGTAVIIHHVDQNRSQPPWVIDADVPPANFADTEGVMWKVGETFSDPFEGYNVEVLSTTSNGFRIRITAPGDLIFKDGFES